MKSLLKNQSGSAIIVAVVIALVIAIIVLIVSVSVSQKDSPDEPTPTISSLVPADLLGAPISYAGPLEGRTGPNGNLLLSCYESQESYNSNLAHHDCSFGFEFSPTQDLPIPADEDWRWTEETPPFMSKIRDDYYNQETQGPDERNCWVFEFEVMDLVLEFDEGEPKTYRPYLLSDIINDPSNQGRVICSSVDAGSNYSWWAVSVSIPAQDLESAKSVKLLIRGTPAEFVLFEIEFLQGHREAIG